MQAVQSQWRRLDHPSPLRSRIVSSRFLPAFFVIFAMLFGLAGCKDSADTNQSLDQFKLSTAKELADNKKTLLAVQEILGKDVMVLNQNVQSIADIQKTLDSYKQSTESVLIEYKKALTATQEVLGKEIISLNQKVTELEAELDAVSTNTASYHSAVFDPRRPRVYKRLDTNLGTLLVSLDSIVATTSDLRVTLSIGNPSNMAFHGFKVNATWGAGLQKEFSLTETLRPASWSKATFTIPKTSVKDIEQLEFGIVAGRISTQ